MPILFIFFLISCNPTANLKNSSDLGSILVTSNYITPPPNILNGEEWILIPKNAGSMGLDAFWVMKYEAKALLEASSVLDADGLGVSNMTHRAVSMEDALPWRNIGTFDAALECESLGDGFRLISNSEWMAIARDVEGVDANWTGGTVGVGCLVGGNSGGTTCGYDGANPEGGAGRNPRAKHVLSTGDEVFDLSGNVWEFNDWDDLTPGFQAGPTTCAAGSLNSVFCVELSDSDFNTLNGNYDQSKGVGYFYGSSGGVPMRGGDMSHGSSAWNNSGIFTLHLGNTAPSPRTNVGFRCVYKKP
ncbi:MAG: hypothetical protein N4A33_08350 [Bacteriovoracaceae bacterium]|jgi:hypothetical protein|nr:hypothetical protein [Bacteriovoracaceae bacterium]